MNKSLQQSNKKQDKTVANKSNIKGTKNNTQVQNSNYDASSLGAKAGKKSIPDSNEGMPAKITVDYMDHGNIVGNYQYQGFDGKMPGENTRDDIANHIPNGYMNDNVAGHLDDDVHVVGTSAKVYVYKPLIDRIVLTDNGKIIQTIQNQGESNTEDYLMDSFHMNVKNSINSNQPVKFGVALYNQGKNNILTRHYFSNSIDDNYQAVDGKAILDSIDKQYGNDPQAYVFHNATITVPVTKISQSVPQQSDHFDYSDYDENSSYHNITVNYIDKDTGQAVGNSFTDSGKNDQDMDFDLLNEAMTNVPRGYKYLYMQRPQLDPIPTNQSITVTVAKEQAPQTIVKYITEPVASSSASATSTISSVVNPQVSSASPVTSSMQTPMSNSSSFQSDDNKTANNKKIIPQVKNLRHVKVGQMVEYHDMMLIKESNNIHHMLITKPLLAHTTLDSIGTTKHYGSVIQPNTVLTVKSVWKHNGSIRYVVSLHGRTYFVTGNSKYVYNAYYKPAKHLRRKVNFLKPTYSYKLIDHKFKVVKRYYKGTNLQVRRVIKVKHNKTMFQLMNGQYVTGSRLFMHLIDL